MGVTVGDVLEGERRPGGLRPVTSGQMDALSDEQLVARFGGQEVEAAISRLYDRYGRTVFGVGLKMLSDRSLAEELTQEVFLKVWRSFDTFDPALGGFPTWLFRVTRSAALDLHRKRARRVHPVAEGDSQILAARDDSAGPQEIADESWLAWRVSRALDALDAPYREVIELAYFGGFSQREISRRTGVPLGTVKTRTARAFKSLREELVLADAWRAATR